MQEQGLTCAAPVHIPPSQGSAGSARHHQPELVLFLRLRRSAVVLIPVQLTSSLMLVTRKSGTPSPQTRPPWINSPAFSAVTSQWHQSEMGTNQLGWKNVISNIYLSDEL